MHSTHHNKNTFKDFRRPR